MRLRIAVWTVSGALVVALQFVYLMATHAPLHGLRLALICLTCPIALARHHPMSVYFVLLVNAATYTLIGALIETISQHYKSAHQLSH